MRIMHGSQGVLLSQRWLNIFSRSKELLVVSAVTWLNWANVTKYLKRVTL